MPMCNQFRGKSRSSKPLSQSSLSGKQASRSSSPFPPLPSRNQLVRKRKYIQTTRLEILLSREGYFKRELYPNDRGPFHRIRNLRRTGRYARVAMRSEAGVECGIRGHLVCEARGQICWEDGDSGGGRSGCSLALLTQYRIGAGGELKIGHGGANISPYFLST